jgi:hypothetical protein
MSWTDELIAGIKDAVRRDGRQRIAVHTEAQAELGRRAAGRMAQNPDDLTFEICPPAIPVGSLLV